MINSRRVMASTDPDANGHEYVDFGLLSGTLWATMNVGASSETYYGDYYMYGNSNRNYTSNYIYGNTENPLAATADTATQVWGGSWHMPTKIQMQELVDNTTYTWKTNFNGSGINGGKFTSKTDSSKYIFLPAAGYLDNDGQHNAYSQGFYWSSTPNGSSSTYSCRLEIYNAGKVVNNGHRRFGYSVRPVIG